MAIPTSCQYVVCCVVASPHRISVFCVVTSHSVVILCCVGVVVSHNHGHVCCVLRGVCCPVMVSVCCVLRSDKFHIRVSVLRVVWLQIPSMCPCVVYCVLTSTTVCQCVLCGDKFHIRVSVLCDARLQV